MLDRLTISSAQGMGADYLGLAAQRRRSGKPDEEEGAALQAPRRSQPPQTAANPVEAPAASAVAAELGQEWPPLTAAEANELLAELLPALAASHPLKLAEAQPVTERSLVPTAYV